MKKITYLLNEWMVLILPLVLVVVFLLGIYGIKWGLGIGGFGPSQNLSITVTRLYVDYSGSKDSSSSHYMVGTDQGVFEISNFLIPVQIFNADELYSQLGTGKTYQVTVKGNKVVNWIFQQYPYIIEIH